MDDNTQTEPRPTSSDRHEMDNLMLILPPQIEESLRRVIDYLWADEYRSYQETPPARRSTHICASCTGCGVAALSRGPAPGRRGSRPLIHYNASGLPRPGGGRNRRPPQSWPDVAFLP